MGRYGTFRCVIMIVSSVGERHWLNPSRVIGAWLVRLRFYYAKMGGRGLGTSGIYPQIRGWRLLILAFLRENFSGYVRPVFTDLHNHK